MRRPMVPVKKFREAVFLALYALDLSGEDFHDESLFMDQLSISKKNIKLAFERAISMKPYFKKFDQLIADNSPDYEFERIASIERSALRLGLYEALIDDSIPIPVAIAESIRVAKKFGSIEGSRFVNAVLDTAIKKSVNEPNQSETQPQTSSPS